MNTVLLEHEYKGYNITTCEQPCMRKVRSIGKGALPKALAGLYTSVGDAQRAIDIYVRSKG